MKNLIARALVVSVVLIITIFTQPAAALPRYSYSDTYYDADSYNSYGGPVYCMTFENGHNDLYCNGDHDRSGTLTGRFRHYYQFDCSWDVVVADQWYFYSDSCGGRWIEINETNCYQDRCLEAI